jgi:hypothetical protein
MSSTAWWQVLEFLGGGLTAGGLFIVLAIRAERKQSRAGARDCCHPRGGSVDTRGD